MKFTDRKLLFGAGILLAAILGVHEPENIYAAVPEAQMDGVMGQSIENETGEEELLLDERILNSSPQAKVPALYGASSSFTDAFLEASFTMKGPYTGKTYYHKREYEDYNLFHGIDVSWWQGGGKGSTSTKIDWEKAHDDGIDFVMVRAGSRDTEDGSIYEDTCANAHIQGALSNDMNVGLYIFSQAVTEKEAREEADYLLMQIERYGWDITMPLIIDREAGRVSKKLKAGKLSKSKETAVCQAFADIVHDAGYEAAVYASQSWFKNYIDSDSLDCEIWIARYNNTTTSNTQSGTPYADVPSEYSYWQYTSTGVSLSGYSSSSLDMDFWYKDTSIKTTGLKVESKTEDSITLSWSEAGDAPGYRVYRYNDETDKYVKIAETSELGYTDSGLDAASNYSYKVRGCWNIGGTYYYGAYSSVVSAGTKLAVVQKIMADTRGTTSLTLTWDEAEGTDGYLVYQYNEDSDSYEQIADVTDTSYKVTGLKPAKTCRFKICTYVKENENVTKGSKSAAYSFTTKPEKTTGLQVKTKSSTSVKLTWKKVSGAKGYEVYRKNPATGNYKKIITISNSTISSYTDKKLSAGTKYTYKVRAYINDNGEYYYGSYSDAKSKTTGPGKVKKLSFRAKSTSVTLKWSKVKGAGGYQVYRLNNRTKKYERIKTVTGNTYTNTGRKKKTVYTYKVRAYRIDDGQTYYGDFSSAVRVQTK